tara:strand:+ start:5414 stop:7027 length:1614 start_codon:yes stop_codon:yes gene_type:complete
MKIKKLLPSLLAILGVLIVMASCEEDFNTLGSEVIDQNIEIPDTVFDVVSYSRKLPPIRTNGLPTNQLGIYNDPNYGTMRVNLLGQVLLPQGLQNPDFPNDGPNADTGDPGDEFEISKVYLHIPFFNQSTTDGDGETSFTLDSVYGSQPMNITFYRSNYLLRDLDPGSNFEDPQPYYSNQTPLFERFLNDELGRLEDFVPSNEAIEIFTATDTINYEPGLLVEFNPDYFKENIIDQEGEEVLLTNENFKNYFRGIYMDVEEAADGNLFLFNPDNINVTIYFSSNTEERDDAGNRLTDDDGNIIRVNGSYEMPFSGITVNTFENEPLPNDLQTALANPNISEGEETLYLRGGGDGIITYIEVLEGDADGNGIRDVEDIRTENWLINDANLKFYVDQEKIAGGASEPDRIQIFNVDNGDVLVDYSFDFTAGEAAFEALTTHLGKLERGSDNIGDFYKIRITNHLNDVIRNDSTNVALGLVVTQNVLFTDFSEVQLSQAPGLNSVPQGTIISHEGTVLHGNLSPNLDKRLRLEIFYTKPQ